MNCPSCGAANLSARHYCGKCGGSLGYPCPDCHFFNGANDTYCGGCGTLLEEAEKTSTAIHHGASSSSPPQQSLKKASLPERDALKEIFKKAARTEDQQTVEAPASQSEIDSIFENMQRNEQSPENGQTPSGNEGSAP